MINSPLTPTLLRELPSHVQVRRGILDLWSISLEAPMRLVTNCEMLLSLDERERARRFVNARDQRRYILAHSALRLLLARYTGMNPCALRFVSGSHGKPLLADEDACSISFNMSHAAKLALVAITAEADLGVDIEELRVLDDFAAIARSHFSVAEVAALANVPSPEAATAFLTCWTRKEAFVKALGGGLSIDLNRFDVDISRERPALLRIDGDAASARKWSMLHLEPALGYVGAAVIDCPMPDVRFRQLDPGWAGHV
jgi:4'-phosphopantetheinyl transferase